MGMVYGVRVELHVDFSHFYSHVYLVSRVTVKQLTVDMSLLLQNVILFCLCYQKSTLISEY